MLSSEAELEFLIDFSHDEIVGSSIPDKVILPVTEFSTETEANEIWGRVELSLTANGLGPPNIWPDVDGILAELVFNAAQHSFSRTGCSAAVEIYLTDFETVYVIGVADAGIGILSSLRKNPTYGQIGSDTNAIYRATELGVTGTEEQRGVGLHFVAERVRAYSEELAIISGEGYLIVKAGGEPTMGNLKELDMPYHGGTMALVSLPIPLVR